MENILNPEIFTKKNFAKQLEPNEETLALEYVLGMVCKLYYKSSFDVEDYMRLFNLDNKGYLNGETRKTKKGKRKKPNYRRNSHNDDDSSKQGKSSLGKTEIMQEAPIDAGLDLLEQLVSPIRQDKEFGIFDFLWEK
jgi:hypothetical protein